MGKHNRNNDRQAIFCFPLVPLASPQPDGVLQHAKGHPVVHGALVLEQQVQGYGLSVKGYIEQHICLGPSESRLVEPGRSRLKGPHVDLLSDVFRQPEFEKLPCKRDVPEDCVNQRIVGFLRTVHEVRWAEYTVVSCVWGANCCLLGNFDIGSMKSTLDTNAATRMPGKSRLMVTSAAG